MIKRYDIASDGCTLCLNAQFLGKDICLTLTGGGKPSDAHIGAVALAVPHMSLSGQGISASASLLTVSGHKEDLLVRTLALNVAKRTNVTVVCICGIHIDNGHVKDFILIKRLAKQLIERFLAELE